jgi:hypothetical protein
VTKDETVTAAVQAALAKVQAPIDFEAAVWDLYHVHGMSGGAIARLLQAELIRRGIPLEEMRGMGVWQDSIYRTVKKPRPRNSLPPS